MVSAAPPITTLKYHTSATEAISEPPLSQMHKCRTHPFGKAFQISCLCSNLYLIYYFYDLLDCPTSVVWYCPLPQRLSRWKCHCRLCATQIPENSLNGRGTSGTHPEILESELTLRHIFLWDTCFSLIRVPCLPEAFLKSYRFEGSCFPSQKYN